MSKVLRLIARNEKLTLDACDGKRTIAKATDVFSDIHRDFMNYGTDVEGKVTLKSVVEIYKMVDNANFATIFGELADDIVKLVLTQDQILNFVQKYRRWLRKDGQETFFLFQAADPFFVARVDAYSGNDLRAFVFPFEFDYIWSAASQRQLVAPQL